MEPTRHPIAFSCHRHTRTTERNRSMKQKSMPCSHLNPTTSIYARLWELLWAQAKSESPWLHIIHSQNILNICSVFQNICFLLSGEGPAGISAVVALRSCGRQGSFAKFQWLHHWRTKIMFIAAQIWKLDLKHKLPAILLVLDVHKNLGFPIGYETAWGVSCGWIPSSSQDVSWCQWPPVGRPTPKAWHPDGIFVHVTTLEVPEQRRNHLATHWY